MIPFQLKHIPKDSTEQLFNNLTDKIIASISKINPNYKELLSINIYQIILRLVGVEYASKVTDILIDQPIINIKNYMKSFNEFTERVEDAKLSILVDPIMQ